VPRIRWAERCSARSTATLRPCTAWAIRGGAVCVAHGGGSPQARREAGRRLAEQAAQRMVARALDRWHRRTVVWQVRRVAVAAEMLGIAPERVGWAEIVWCHTVYGVPPLDDEAPRASDVRLPGRTARVLGGPAWRA